MKLDDSSKQKILDLWEQRVRQSLPPARTQPSFALRNNLPAFLDKMLAALKNGPSFNETTAINKVSAIHGVERALIEKYSLAQVLKEYSILRLTVIEVLGSDGSIGTGDQIVIHRRIDEAEMIAVTAFEEVRSKGAHLLNDEIRRHSEDLEQFAAIAAHDLRGPIATIYSYIKYIEDECKNQSDDVKQGFEFIAISTKKLLHLIDRLLNYAKVGVAEPKIERVDLNKLLDDVTASLGKAIADSHARVLYKNLPVIQSDPLLLTQLFQNLISNSIKFRGPEDPVIQIKLENEDPVKWTLSVQDNGIGFEQKQNEVIFKAFQRLHSEGKYQGSGLGLATVRRVTEALGGEIWGESEPGKGAKFIFTLIKPPEISRGAELSH